MFRKWERATTTIYVIFDEARHYSTLSNAWLSNPPRYWWSSCCKQCPRCLHAAIPNVPRMQFLQPNEPSCRTNQKHTCWNKKHKQVMKMMQKVCCFQANSSCCLVDSNIHRIWSSVLVPWKDATDVTDRDCKRLREIFISAFHSILCTSHYHRQGILFFKREHSNMASCCMDLAMWTGIHQFFYSTTGL